MDTKNSNLKAVDGKSVKNEQTPAAPAVTNFVLAYRREHPQNRCSFGIAGNPGIVVFDKGLFADPNNIPAHITLDVQLVPVKAIASQDKMAKAAEKAEAAAKKAQERLEAAQKKQEERALKLKEQLAKAQTKLATAQTPSAQTVQTPAAQPKA